MDQNLPYPEQFYNSGYPNQTPNLMFQNHGHTPIYDQGMNAAYANQVQNGIFHSPGQQQALPNHGQNVVFQNHGQNVVFQNLGHHQVFHNQSGQNVQNVAFINSQNQVYQNQIQNMGQVPGFAYHNQSESVRLNQGNMYFQQGNIRVRYSNNNSQIIQRPRMLVGNHTTLYLQNNVKVNRMSDQVVASTSAATTISQPLTVSECCPVNSVASATPHPAVTATPTEQVANHRHTVHHTGVDGKLPSFNQTFDQSCHPLPEPSDQAPAVPANQGVIQTFQNPIVQNHRQNNPQRVRHPISNNNSFSNNSSFYGQNPMAHQQGMNGMPQTTEVPMNFIQPTPDVKMYINKSSKHVDVNLIGGLSDLCANLRHPNYGGDSQASPANNGGPFHQPIVNSHQETAYRYAYSHASNYFHNSMPSNGNVPISIITKRPPHPNVNVQTMQHGQRPNPASYHQIRQWLNSSVQDMNGGGGSIAAAQVPQQSFSSNHLYNPGFVPCPSNVQYTNRASSMPNHLQHQKLNSHATRIPLPPNLSSLPHIRPHPPHNSTHGVQPNSSSQLQTPMNDCVQISNVPTACALTTTTSICNDVSMTSAETSTTCISTHLSVTVTNTINHHPNIPVVTTSECLTGKTTQQPSTSPRTDSSMDLAADKYLDGAVSTVDQPSAICIVTSAPDSRTKSKHGPIKTTESNEIITENSGVSSTENSCASSTENSCASSMENSGNLANTSTSSEKMYGASASSANPCNPPGHEHRTLQAVNHSSSPVKNEGTCEVTTRASVESSPCIVTSCASMTACCQLTISLTNPVTSVMSSSAVPKTDAVTFVPFGWRRVTEMGRVVYYSPSDSRVSSMQNLRHYLLMDGTCKCGLNCPLNVDAVFSFDPTVGTREVTVDMVAAQSSSATAKLCNHSMKTSSLAALRCGMWSGNSGGTPWNVTPMNGPRANLGVGGSKFPTRFPCNERSDPYEVNADCVRTASHRSLDDLNPSAAPALRSRHHSDQFIQNYQNPQHDFQRAQIPVMNHPRQIFGQFDSPYHQPPEMARYAMHDLNYPPVNHQRFPRPSHRFPEYNQLNAAAPFGIASPGNMMSPGNVPVLNQQANVIVPNQILSGAQFSNGIFHQMPQQVAAFPRPHNASLSQLNCNIIESNNLSEPTGFVHPNASAPGDMQILLTSSSYLATSTCSMGPANAVHKGWFNKPRIRPKRLRNEKKSGTKLCSNLTQKIAGDRLSEGYSKSASFLENPSAFLAQQTAMVQNSIAFSANSDSDISSHSLAMEGLESSFESDAETSTREDVGTSNNSEERGVSKELGGSMEESASKDAVSNSVSYPVKPFPASQLLSSAAARVQVANQYATTVSSMFLQQSPRMSIPNQTLHQADVATQLSNDKSPSLSRRQTPIEMVENIVANLGNSVHSYQHKLTEGMGAPINKTATMATAPDKPSGSRILVENNNGVISTQSSLFFPHLSRQIGGSGSCQVNDSSVVPGDGPSSAAVATSTDQSIAGNTAVSSLVTQTVTTNSFVESQPISAGTVTLSTAYAAASACHVTKSCDAISTNQLGKITAPDTSKESGLFEDKMATPGLQSNPPIMDQSLAQFVYVPQMQMPVCQIINAVPGNVDPVGVTQAPIINRSYNVGMTPLIVPNQNVALTGIPTSVMTSIMPGDSVVRAGENIPGNARGAPGSTPVLTAASSGAEMPLVPQVNINAPSFDVGASNPAAFPLMMTTANNQAAVVPTSNITNGNLGSAMNIINLQQIMNLFSTQNITAAQLHQLQCLQLQQQLINHVQYLQALITQLGIQATNPMANMATVAFPATEQKEAGKSGSSPGDVMPQVAPDSTHDLMLTDPASSSAESDSQVSVENPAESIEYAQSNEEGEDTSDETSQDTVINEDFSAEDVAECASRTRTRCDANKSKPSKGTDKVAAATTAMSVEGGAVGLSPPHVSSTHSQQTGETNGSSHGVATTIVTSEGIQERAVTSTIAAVPSLDFGIASSQQFPSVDAKFATPETSPILAVSSSEETHSASNSLASSEERDVLDRGTATSTDVALTTCVATGQSTIERRVLKRRFDIKRLADEHRDLDSGVRRGFRDGDLVWGQSKGYQSWPGKVLGAADSNDECLVRWFGDHSIVRVSSSKLQTLSEGLEAQHTDRQAQRKTKKLNPQLSAAIQEAMTELDSRHDSRGNKKKTSKKSRKAR